MTTVRRLLCHHPDSEEQIDFQVLPGIDHNIPVYYLESHPQINHSAIDRLSIRKVSILTHNKYDLTLEEWLDNNTDNWCPIYQNWNVNRPTEEARQLIQCILVAVYNLHSKGICHGFLDNPKNYFIECEEPNHEGDHRKIKLVHLIHENRTPNTSERQKQQEDMQALKRVIFERILRDPFERILRDPPFGSIRRDQFGRILRDPVGRILRDQFGRIIREKYPADLSHLNSLLSTYQIFGDWKFIVDHPSLWHWKLRFGYIERVWMQFLHATSSLKNDMHICFKQVPDTKYWMDRIPPNTSLERIFENNDYRQTNDELLRYVRIVRFHYRDTKSDRTTGMERFCYIINLRDEKDYLDEKFIEHVTTRISGLLLVYLHRMVLNLCLEI